MFGCGAVRRTEIVSTGFAGRAGSFRLCRKHSLHGGTAVKAGLTALTVTECKKIPKVSLTLWGDAER